MNTLAPSQRIQIAFSTARRLLNQQPNKEQLLLLTEIFLTRFPNQFTFDSSFQVPLTGILLALIAFLFLHPLRNLTIFFFFGGNEFFFRIRSNQNAVALEIGTIDAKN